MAQVPPPSFVLTEEQVQTAQGRIDAFTETIKVNPDQRSGGWPYAMLHKAGESVYGTVMVFHGFSAKPEQMHRLAKFLFDNNFNVYSASIAGHYLIHPSRNWPQVNMKPAFADKLRDKVMNSGSMSAFITQQGGDQKPSITEIATFLGRLFLAQPLLPDIIKAAEVADDPDFERYFDSTHMEYLNYALARLADIDPLPGPVFPIGLSVGGAVAVGLAAARPDKIPRVVAMAPLLRVWSTKRRQYVIIAGPLGVQEFGWDPNLKFPMSCFTATDRFGASYVRSPKALETLRGVPTFLMLTDNEDAADIETNLKFFDEIGGADAGHFLYKYAADDKVPHPLVEPTEVSQGMSNRFYQRLYQEIFRFLTSSSVNLSGFNTLQQQPDVPLVPAV